MSNGEYVGLDRREVNSILDRRIDYNTTFL